MTPRTRPRVPHVHGNVKCCMTVPVIVRLPFLVVIEREVKIENCNKYKGRNICDTKCRNPPPPPPPLPPHPPPAPAPPHPPPRPPAPPPVVSFGIGQFLSQQHMRTHLS